MQISQRFLWLSLTAILFSPVALWAQATNSDNSLEAALQSKLKEMQSAPAATAPGPAQPAAMPPTAPPTAAAPAAAVAASSKSASPEDDKISEALHRKMNELEAEKPASQGQAGPVYMPLPSSNPPPVHVAAQPTSRDAAIAAAVAQANAAQAREDQAARMNSAMARPGATQKSRAVAASRTPLVLPVLQGPPSSLSGSQQTQLQALDQQYLSDQLTSEQYHARRAKIVSGK